MAIQVCRACSERFRHDQVGRPPALCPSCKARGVKAPPKVKDPIPQYEAPKAIDSLPKDDENQDQGNQGGHSLRPNKYQGICHECRGVVAAGAGVLYKVDPDMPSKPFHDNCLRSWQEERRNNDQGTQEAPKPAQDDQDTNGHLIRQIGESDAAEAIKTLLQTLTPSIDEDGVRKIVQDAIGNQLDPDRIKALIQASGVIRHEIVVNEVRKDMPTVHHYLLPELVKMIGAGVHVFLPGPAGSGKSTLAMQAAEMLGLSFHSISFGPTTPTSKLFGFIDANGTCHTTEFRKAYECLCDDDGYDYADCQCGGLFLGDEIDNGHPGLVAELNQALANPYCAFADRMVRKGRLFVMVVSGNTFGTGPDRKFVGRNKLDAATLDRFTIMETPIDEAMETRAAMAWSTEDTADTVTKWIQHVQKVRRAADEANLDMVISPRASIDGAKMLAAGIDWPTVVNTRLVPGVKPDIRSQIGA